MKYRLIDLIEDTSFINWAHQANNDDVSKWNLYLQQNPHQQPLIEEALLIVRGIPFTPKRLEPQYVDEQWHKLRQHLITQPLPHHSKSYTSIFKSYRYLVVTCLGMLLGVVGYWYMKIN